MRAGQYRTVKHDASMQALKSSHNVDQVKHGSLCQHEDRERGTKREESERKRVHELTLQCEIIDFVSSGNILVDYYLVGLRLKPSRLYPVFTWTRCPRDPRVGTS